MNTPKKQVTKSTKRGQIKLTQEETVSALPVQSGVRAGTVASPVSFKSFRG